MRIRGEQILKTIKNSLVFVLCLVVRGGCFTREGRIVGGKIHGGSNSIDVKYKKFTGFATQDMNVKKGESWIFSFGDKTKQGTIKAYVLDSNDNTILEVNSRKSKNIK
ncbi:Lipoprotein [Bacillus albus]